MVDKFLFTSQMKQTFGEIIRTLRTKHGWTLTKLAAQLEMDSANLSKVENGKREFDQKRLKKLAGAFELDLEKPDVRDDFFNELFHHSLRLT